ncbi:ABC transporter ATP-binding protein [Joostella atrarenae]|uniref:ABC transporter ATP-binding protein n=1 Tax=Joostella atrarenae TaxID=679257 RepID=A0ABS9J320_9FLAO|nr:ABC transporter ATP-binding protein [Joostella atrarenae]MCF8714750.1 ABC transporter ATP-binding protein [Joostella atrarenae]
MIIAAEEITKKYGGVTALKEVSISCNSGEIVGLLGKNGAGKTTLFKILFGLIHPDSGRLKINSEKVKPLGGIIEKPALYEYLNAKENIKVFSKIQGLDFNTQQIEDSLLKVGLPLDRNDPVKNFSMGMKQRLGIAIALLNNPACLVLDEPFSGLDPIGIKAIRKLILELVSKEKIGIIISSHITEELSKICDVLYVINKGTIISKGETQKIIAENTTSFSIYASGIENSISIKKYPAIIKKNSAEVTISQQEIPELLQQLTEEKIFITACVPEINFDKLFESPSL